MHVACCVWDKVKPLPDLAEENLAEAPAGIRTRDLPLSRGVTTRLTRGRPHTGLRPWALRPG